MKDGTIPPAKVVHRLLSMVARLILPVALYATLPHREQRNFITHR
jgi:hypothetical protein